MKETTKLYVRQTAKLWLKFALYVLLLWALFFYVFDFSKLQGFGLALVIMIAIDVAASRRGPAKTTFRPHQVRFATHLHPMLLDLGLVKSDEEYTTVAGEPRPWIPWSDNHVFHHWIRAYVLSHDPSKDARAELVHFPELGSYSNRLEITLKIESIRRAGQFSGWSPELFVRLGMEGYDIGINVNEHWWKENKSTVAPGVVLEERTEYNVGRVRLVMAVFPYQAFHEFYMTSRDHQVGIKKIVSAKGWENDALGGAEIGYFGEEYKHKYVTIWLQDFD